MCAGNQITTKQDHTFMEKIISSAAVARLTAKEKDWDFAIIYVHSKQPVMIEKASNVAVMDTEEGSTIVMDSIVLNPVPLTEEDSKKHFNMQSYIKISALTAIDFYTERKIQTVAPILSLV